MDSFYVREMGGGPIRDSARHATVELALRSAIGQLELV